MLMHGSARLFVPLLALAAATAAPAAAQTLPTSEPEILVITRERIRPGHEGPHTLTEAARAATYAAAGSPDYYLAMTSMTGSAEAWFVQPWATYTDWGQARARNAADPTLVSSLARTAADDAVHVERRVVVEAVAAPTLGHGTPPNLNLVRFWHITTMLVRPGHEDAFAAAMQAYRAVVARADPNASWRVFRVTNGMPRGTFLIFSSFEAFTQFDDLASADDAVSAAMTASEREALRTFSREGVRLARSNRFSLDPTMSYVSEETRSLDPAFWRRR
jgi:hypothetical protein